MPYEFSENEFELEPQTAASRGGSPPLKRSGIGVLDPPFPPKRPPGPIPAAPLSRLFRIVAAVVLVALAVALIMLIFATR